LSGRGQGGGYGVGDDDDGDDDAEVCQYILMSVKQSFGNCNLTKARD
jgi:hypothetical protein